MKLKLTSKLPTKVGYYWYCNFGEHTPVVLEVTRDHESRKLWAHNEEFCFEIQKVNLKQVIKENQEMEMEKVDGHHHGEELWCYIPNPYVENKQVEPDSY